MIILQVLLTSYVYIASMSLFDYISLTDNHCRRSVSLFELNILILTRIKTLFETVFLASAISQNALNHEH